MNRWYSVYGTGLTIFGVTHTSDGRVEFTVWASLFDLPLVPLSSWSAAGARARSGIAELNLGFDFADLTRVPHDPARLARTVQWGLFYLATVAVPLAALLHRTQGRAATTLEFVLVLAVTVWAAALLIGCEVRREQALTRPIQSRHAPPGPRPAAAHPGPSRRRRADQG